MFAMDPEMASPGCAPSARALVVVMGVAGSGKSSVGTLLAHRLGCPFIEGDRFHPESNLARMRAGLPLQAEHRTPWISSIVDEVNRVSRRDAAHRVDHAWLAVLACSALSSEIRERLRIEVVGAHCRFVHLHGGAALIRRRLAEREGHFFGADLLDSQFRALQAPGPSEAIRVGIDRPLDDVVDAILGELSSACAQGITA